MSTFDDICREEAEAGETVVVASQLQSSSFSPPYVHRYIDMLRRMLLARFQADSYHGRLQGPRIGVLVRLVSEATGLNQTKLAQRIGVDPTYMSKLVNEKEAAGLSFLESLYAEWEKVQPYERLPQKQRLSNEYTPSGDDPTEAARPVGDPNSPLPADAPSAGKVAAEKKTP